ncbi:hypothetical protein ARMSODRAFT_976159 [Armillaria solidipes]|uniref:Uncharacterized protein n=1 Tax=Armillaria solidipes TaxID=1076256 RepID=A0A2H3BUU6_9AGAR|nr:hypothetical protein ARMSODRAFT_976159 [Armillaria solidipes]
MSTPRHTCEKAVTIPKELQKCTQKQIRQECDMKIAAAQEAKQRWKTATEAKAKMSIDHVASQQDKDALDDKKLQLFRPDLEEPNDIPVFSAGEASPIPDILPMPNTHSPVLTPEPSYDAPTNIDGADDIELSPATTVDSDSEPGTVNDYDAIDKISDSEAEGVSSGDDSEYQDDGSDAESAESSADVEANAAMGNESGSGEHDEEDTDQMEDWQVEFAKFIKEKKARIDAAKAVAAKRGQKKGKTPAPAVLEGVVKVEKAEKHQSVGAAERKGKASKGNKKGRLDICKAVSAACTEPSAQVIPQPKAEPTASGHGKKCPHTEVGGLVPNWQQVHSTGPDKRAPTPALVIMPMSAPPIQVKKEGVVEAAIATYVADNEARVPQASETGRKTAEKNKKGAVTSEIVLKEASVKKIEAKEHGKKSVFKNHDLPFTDFGADISLWQQRLIPPILNWSGCEILEPFSMTGLPEFKANVRTLWTKIFAHLVVVLLDGSIRADCPAIATVAATAVRTHRSEIGKSGHKNIELTWSWHDMRSYATIKARKEWVQQGAFRGRLVLETFTYHLQVTMNAQVTYRNPAAALALSAMAEGYDSYTLKETTAKNSEFSFKDNPWGTVAQKYYKKTSTLGEEKWKEIFQEAANYLPKGQKNKVVTADGGVQGSGDGKQCLDSYYALG